MIDPKTGLPMINPATGLPMSGSGGTDMQGNPYGINNSFNSIHNSNNEKDYQNMGKAEIIIFIICFVLFMTLFFYLLLRR